MVIPQTWIREKWYCISTDSPQSEWDRMAEKMLEFGESGHPVFRATSPLSRGRLKNCRSTVVPIWKRFTTVLRTLTSVKQLSLYGAVAEMCEKMNPITIERGDKLWEDSRVPRVIKTNVPLNNDDPLHIKNFYCKDAENELNSYHNKTEWANFVQMQDSWLLLKSDSTSGQRTLKSSHILQNHCPVVRHLAKRRRHIWTEGLDQREHQNWARIGSYNLLPTR